MLKRRIVACLPVCNGVVVQSIQFAKYLPVGRLPTAVEFLARWGIDEIVILDISARKATRGPDLEYLRTACRKAHVPTAIGGGINCLRDVESLLKHGADKIVLNRALFDDPTLITQVARAYGDQCVVVSIDAVSYGSAYYVYNYLERKREQLNVLEACRKAIALGAGEILINSIERDGTYTGYDINLISAVCKSSTVPVIACGGAKNASDIAILFEQTNVSAAAAGNFFHFTENSVTVAKQYLMQRRDDIRMDSSVTYSRSSIDADHRLKKLDDTILEDLLYEHIEEESI